MFFPFQCCHSVCCFLFRVEPECAARDLPLNFHPLAGQLARKTPTMNDPVSGDQSTSETFRQPKPNNATAPCWTNQPLPHNLNQKGRRQTRHGSHIVWSVDLSPRHSWSPSNLSSPTESQPLKSLTSFWNRDYVDGFRMVRLDTRNLSQVNSMRVLYRCPS